jgi:GNAT superfamily N-acetyltransferase
MIDCKAKPIARFQVTGMAATSARDALDCRDGDLGADRRNHIFSIIGEILGDRGQMEIRPANIFDLPAIKRIVADAYRIYVDRIGKPPAPMLDDYSVHIRNYTARVAEQEGSVVGLIVLLPAGDHLLLDNLAVDPAHHGRGFGRALLEFAEHEARRLNYPELRLYTHEKMTENLAMYAALGWEETGRGEQAGYWRVFFRKRVAGTPAS